MIHRSPLAEHPIPEVSLPRFVFAWKAPPDRAAFIDGTTGATTTYAELQRDATRLSAALAARGFGSGEVFALLLPNCAEFGVALLGVTAAGGVVLPIDPQLTPMEVGRRLGECGAMWLLTLPSFLARARMAVAMTPAPSGRVRQIVVLGDVPGALSFRELIAHDAPVPRRRIDAQDDLALLSYSSGTSGMPKAAMLTHFNAVAQLVQLDAVLPTEEDGLGTRVAAMAPFFDMHGLFSVLLSGLRRGRTLVVLPRFDAAACLRLAEQHAAVLAAPVRAGLKPRLKHSTLERYDLSQLTCIACGSATHASDMEEACAARLGCGVAPSYSITEMAGAVAMPLPGLPTRSGAVGRLLPGCEARVVDPHTRHDVGRGDEGELWLRGPTRMRGYLGRPSWFEPGGWLRTGDVARFDASGCLTIVDRAQDLAVGCTRGRAASRPLAWAKPLA